MGKKFCGECVHLKFEDADGLGWCDLWEESDVHCKDDACIEFEEKEDEYGRIVGDEGSA